MEKLTSKYQEMDFELKNLFISLRQDLGLEKIDVIMKNEASNGTEANMTIYFIKYVSSLLALVSAARENNLERHL